jgi:hypothetical protein
MGQHEDFQLRRYREALDRAQRTIDEMHVSLPDPCPYCSHLPYVITATQHCWCDPTEEAREE